MSVKRFFFFCFTSSKKSGEGREGRLAGNDAQYSLMYVSIYKYYRKKVKKIKTSTQSHYKTSLISAVFSCCVFFLPCPQGVHNHILLNEKLIFTWICVQFYLKNKLPIFFRFFFFNPHYILSLVACSIISVCFETTKRIINSYLMMNENWMRKQSMIHIWPYIFVSGLANQQDLILRSSRHPCKEVTVWSREQQLKGKGYICLKNKTCRRRVCGAEKGGYHDVSCGPSSSSTSAVLRASAEEDQNQDLSFDFLSG